MDFFKIRTGSLIGQQHQLSQRNCQDAWAFNTFDLGEAGRFLVGLVCDGCGEGTHSEVGAKLLAEFCTHEIERLLWEFEPAVVPSELYMRALVFLDSISQSLIGLRVLPEVGLTQPLDETKEFIRNYLLATVVGFIVGPEQTVIFAAGDGLILLNEQVVVRDEDNQPNYLAYGLLPGVALGGFDMQVLPTAEVQRLAIWTDGFKPELSSQLWQIQGGPRGLQRQLNLWGRQAFFADDVTGIVVERSSTSHECNN
jgi:hypothetical protein